MREGNVFNGVVYHKGDNLFDLLKKSKGLHTNLVTLVHQRLESSSKTPSQFKIESNFLIIKKFLDKVLPKKSILGSRYLLNIYLLDLLTLYRGWRHSRNLPVRGQRTWSNAWTASKSNILLKQIRIKKGKKMYGNLALSEIYTAQLAEQINTTWKDQWPHEWVAARRHRLKSAVHQNVVKTDLYSMAQGNVMSPIKFQKLSKKQQQSFNKNHFSLGFDAGFTKPLLKDLYELKVSGKKAGKQSSVILHKTDLQGKKQGAKKKKVDFKSKKAAHVAKKKTKKSAWD